MSRRLVVTFGTFDLFHIGHLNVLRRARSLGDQLVVGVSTDRLNFSKKNSNPVFNEKERLAIVAAIRFVDDVFLEESLDLKRQYLTTYRADILVMGDDWAGKFDEFRDICEVVYLSRTEGISTTSIRQQLNGAASPD